MSQRLHIYCDGGSRGNPGPSAAAAVLLDGETVLETVAEYMGITTNNQAEYRAVELGLLALRKRGVSEADFFLDSQLIVRQLNGQYKVKEPGMRQRFLAVQKLLIGLDITFSHVYREDNKLADAAVNICLDAN